MSTNQIISVAAAGAYAYLTAGADPRGIFQVFAVTSIATNVVNPPSLPGPRIGDITASEFAFGDPSHDSESPV